MNNAQVLGGVASPLMQQLKSIIHQKKSRLAISVDLSSAEDVLGIIDAVGSSVCMVKTHVDIINDFTPRFISKLQALKEKHQFLILEDRKFADIGHTSVLQYTGGLYRIIDWADLVTVHALPGASYLEAMSAVAAEYDLPRGALLLAQMSAKGNLCDDAYVRSSLKVAQSCPDFVVGLIGQARLDERLPTFSPGVHLDVLGDARGQQYRSPQDALCRDEVDVVIVGRGILQADSPAKAAETYRSIIWSSGKLNDR